MFGLGLAQAVHRETDGNPFFVTEVLRNLLDTGAIPQNAAGRWVASDTIDRPPYPTGSAK